MRASTLALHDGQAINRLSERVLEGPSISVSGVRNS